MPDLTRHPVKKRHPDEIGTKSKDLLKNYHEVIPSASHKPQLVENMEGPALRL